MAKLTLFYSSVSSSLELKKKQKRIQDVLESYKYEFELVDIAADASAKEKMRTLASNPSALPPQLANGDEYCGSYEDFDVAVEDGALKEFLKL